MNKFNKMIVRLSVSLAVMLFSGCSNQEAALANSLANSAAGASGVSSGSGSFNPNSSLTSPAALKGMGQSQVIGGQMLMNPGVIAAGAVGMAVSEHNQAQNKAAFGKMTDMYVNADKMNSSMEEMMVKSYNQKYGTHYRSMVELQEATKIAGYNKKYGTKYTKLGEVRRDYNKRKGTHYKNDKEFRNFIHGES